jgi:hypothetical protein
MTSPGLARPRRSARIAVAVTALALASLAAASWWGVERVGAASHWQLVQVDVFSNVDLDLLRGYRSVLGVVAIPLLALVCLAVLVVALRWRPLSVVVVAGVAFLAVNLGVQGVKHLVRPLPFLRPWQEDLHLSGHIGMAMGTASLIMVLLPERRGRVARVIVGAALAVAAVGILLSGWHSVSEVVTTLLIAAASVTLLVATLGRPVFTPAVLLSPLTVVGLVALVTAATLGIRDAGAHRDVAAQTSVIVVVGSTLLAYGITERLVRAAVEAFAPKPADDPQLFIGAGPRAATDLAEECRLVAAAGGHRQDWLVCVAAGLGGPSGPTTSEVLDEAGRQGTHPAAWLVLRRALRSRHSPLSPELTGVGTSASWRVVAIAGDRIAPPNDGAVDGTLVRVLATSCRATSTASWRVLLRAAAAAWHSPPSIAPDE